MASTFKIFGPNDKTNTRTLLHEAIPLTGALGSASYGTHPNEENIKNFSHGMWQSIYDYPYLSSSANQIFDITFGFSANSAISSSTPVVQQEKKINVYNQMAQVLMGYDHTGSIQEFDRDGDLLAGGTKLRECFFLNFARLLYKDEIKKGSFTFKFGANAAFNDSSNTSTVTITDAGAENDFRTNSPAGEYGILSCSAGQTAGSTSGLVGLIYYQAGVAVLTASIFNTQPIGLLAANAVPDSNPEIGTIFDVMTGSEISGACDNFRHRWYDMSYNNTTELNSTIYFCRANHNEFNYSANPTYVSGSKIRVKNNTLDEPVTYITTVGLYSADNELLACCKLSEPLKKTPSTDLTIRCRLDW